MQPLFFSAKINQKQGEKPVYHETNCANRPYLAYRVLSRHKKTKNLIKLGGEYANNEISTTQNSIDHKTILVIEDDESIGALITEVLLQETHYDVLLATDAFQALHIVDHVKPSLLITDYRLPRMNGIELYDRLHSSQALNNTPVIIMSAHLPMEEVSKRQLVSMDKPFDLDDLLEKVEGALCA